jgi:hypothetical protein
LAFTRSEMKKRFSVQTAGVCAVVVFVGWPNFAPLPTVTVWRWDSPVAPRVRAIADDVRVQNAQDATRRTSRSAITSESGATFTSPLTGSSSSSSLPETERLPEALSETGAQLNAIVGRARTVTGDPVRYARLVLRNTSTGLIEARATADQDGRFTFLDVIPSGYVVELVGADGSVIASSELVDVDNGALRQATVRVAANSTVRAIFGGTVAPTVQEPVTRASDAGARTVTQPSETNSPQR